MQLPHVKDGNLLVQIPKFNSQNQVYWIVLKIFNLDFRSFFILTFQPRHKYKKIYLFAYNKSMFEKYTMENLAWNVLLRMWDTFLKI